MSNLNVMVCYAATSSEQLELPVTVAQGASVKEAILHSGVLTRYPEIDLSTCPVGIFSKRCQLETLLKSGDRVEIYRPLLIDPKEARRARVKVKAKVKK